jgi:hypothetical protein
MKGPPGRRAANTDPDHPSPPSAGAEGKAQVEQEDRGQSIRIKPKILASNAGKAWLLPAANPRPTGAAEKTKAMAIASIEHVTSTSKKSKT